MPKFISKADREHLLTPRVSEDELHSWISYFIRINVPRVAVCPNHNAPFEYIRHAYFEPAKDCVVIAPRGGGKTKLAAVATMLDLLHKPPCAVRILGGSLEQSLRMWEHILPDMEVWARAQLKKRIGAGRRIELTSGSTAAVLTQSQRAVRGLRVQKLRCDEVEMFKPEIWEAAQLVTKSRGSKSDKMGSDPFLSVSGAIDALSTSHRPDGLMSRLLDSAKITGTKVIRWCILDVLERCPPSRACDDCPLWDECQGIAKTKCNGFFSIDDAIAIKKRTSRETWDAEMLCIRPTVQKCVFPSFNREVHERDLPVPNASEAQRSLSIDFGFANPLACLWIARTGDGDQARVYVFDEYVQEQQTLDVHLQQIEARPWGKIPRVTCDPAGASRNDQTAASNIQLLRRSGYIVRSRKSLIAEGLDLIRRGLRPAHGEPRLFIHPRCVRLIKAMQSYRYGNGTETPVKDGTHDHLIDALRYWYVNSVRDAKMQTRAY